MKHATVRQNVLEIKTKFYKYYSSCHAAHWFSFNPFNAKDVLIDFTLSNARRFYSSKGNPLAVKGLKHLSPLRPCPSLGLGPGNNVILPRPGYVALSSCRTEFNRIKLDFSAIAARQLIQTSYLIAADSSQLYENNGYSILLPCHNKCWLVGKGLE